MRKSTSVRKTSLIPLQDLRTNHSCQPFAPHLRGRYHPFGVPQALRRWNLDLLGLFSAAAQQHLERMGHAKHESSGAQLEMAAVV